MQTEKEIDVDALGQACNSTFGMSSTTVAPTWSVKAKLVSEDRLQVDYLSVITYASETSMRAVEQKYDGESESAINQAVKRIKEDYKNLASSALKAKRVGEPVSSIEPISMSAYGPVRRGYYRRRVVFELG